MSFELRVDRCLWVSFQMFVGLFSDVCGSLFRCLWVSFQMFVGLFSDSCGSLFSGKCHSSCEFVDELENKTHRVYYSERVGIEQFVGLFPDICGSLFRSLRVSFQIFPQQIQSVDGQTRRKDLILWNDVF